MRLKNIENSEENQKFIEIPKKYNIAVMIFESSETDNTTNNPKPENVLNANDDKFNENSAITLEEYKLKMKAEILDYVTNQLKETNENDKNNQIPINNVDSHIVIEEESKTNLIIEEKKPDEISSEEYDEEEIKTGEANVISFEKPLKRDINYYVNVWKSFSKYQFIYKNTYMRKKLIYMI